MHRVGRLLKKLGMTFLNSVQGWGLANADIMGGGHLILSVADGGDGGKMAKNLLT